MLCKTPDNSKGNAKASAIYLDKMDVLNCIIEFLVISESGSLL